MGNVKIQAIDQHPTAHLKVSEECDLHIVTFRTELLRSTIENGIYYQIDEIGQNFVKCWSNKLDSVIETMCLGKPGADHEQINRSNNLAPEYIGPLTVALPLDEPWTGIATQSRETLRK